MQQGSCNLRYIDFSRLGPPEDADSVWVSFMGDSLMRDLFYNAVQRMSGSVCNINFCHTLTLSLLYITIIINSYASLYFSYVYDKEWLNETNRVAPLLALHMGKHIFLF